MVNYLLGYLLNYKLCVIWAHNYKILTTNTIDHNRLLCIDKMHIVLYIFFAQKVFEQYENTYYNSL